MQRWARAKTVVALTPWVAMAAGCGSSPPRESDIYHDPSLRAGQIAPANEAEAALLSQLTADGAVSAGGLSADPAYHAASGRRCRHVRGASAPLACETSDGAWTFVPSVEPGR